MQKRVLFFILVLFVSLNLISAHNPRIISDNPSSILIEKPEVSQAFYSSLNNQPQTFSIVSKDSFNLYLGLLSPYPSGEKDFSLKVYKNNSLIFYLNSSSVNWTHFYEEFAGDDYFQGPELEEKVDSGTYIIQVFSPDNQGKYVLVVGKAELWNFKETLNAFISMPRLKLFFGKSVLSSYFNYIGLFLLISLFVLALLIFFIIFIIRYIRKHL